MTNNLVLQSDFGLVDGAVSAMIGVALQEPSLGVHHLTHDITPYNTFELLIVCFRPLNTGLRGQPLFR